MTHRDDPIGDALATLETMLCTYAPQGRVGYVHPRPMPPADVAARWEVLTNARLALARMRLADGK